MRKNRQICPSTRLDLFRPTPDLYRRRAGKMNVFISGSRSINKLPDSAIKKIDSIMGKNCAILTGSKKGIDAQVQKYLSKKKYDNVIVYFSGREIRNNAAMAHDADCGLMIWDGLSIGTLNAIKEMKNRNKGFCLVVDGTLYDEENSDIAINRLTNR
jgi:hypothetical protein